MIFRTIDNLSVDYSTVNRTHLLHALTDYKEYRVKKILVLTEAIDRAQHQLDYLTMFDYLTMR